MDTTKTINLPATPLTVAGTATSVRRRNWLGRVAAIIVSLAGLAAIGAGVEAIAARSDAATYPPRGELVDIGGYRLHLDCRGDGAPTVVMDAGLGGTSRDWLLVQPALAAVTRVCTYDRAGMGWSDPGPSPRSPARIADELHRLLAAAAIPGPYVLVGHSLAGKNVRMFALAHPDEVAGMVLVDARSERMDMNASADERAGMTAAFEGQGTLFGVLRTFGLVRFLAPTFIGEPLVHDAAALELALLKTTPSAIETTSREGAARADDDAALAAQSLGTIPLAVVAASANMTGLARWADAQKSLAALSTDSRFILADSGHYVQLEKPQVVIDAVLSVLAGAPRR